MIQPSEMYSTTEEEPFVSIYSPVEYPFASPGEHCCEITFDSNIQEIDYGIIVHDIVLYDTETLTTTYKIVPGKTYKPYVWSVNPGTTAKRVAFDVFVGNIKVGEFDSGTTLLTPQHARASSLPPFSSASVLIPSNPNPQLCVVLK